MNNQFSLKEAERKAFQATNNDGLWDVFLGSFFLMFAFAPLLSDRLGDFWSSAIFLPFYAGVYLIIHLVRARIVAPRVGSVTFGQGRKTRMKRFSLILMGVNVIALAAGVFAFLNFGKISDKLPAILFSGLLVGGFSLFAYFIELPRMYIYGLVMGLGIFLGEWLWSNNLASHHGFPLVFGTGAGLMILVGLFIFFRLVLNTPLPPEDFPSMGA